MIVSSRINRGGHLPEARTAGRREVGVKISMLGSSSSGGVVAGITIVIMAGGLDDFCVCVCGGRRESP
jgi:hypothetical protein